MNDIGERIVYRVRVNTIDYDGNSDGFVRQLNSVEYHSLKQLTNTLWERSLSGMVVMSAGFSYSGWLPRRDVSMDICLGPVQASRLYKESQEVDSDLLDLIESKGESFQLGG